MERLRAKLGSLESDLKRNESEALPPGFAVGSSSSPKEEKLSPLIFPSKVDEAAASGRDFLATSRLLEEEVKQLKKAYQEVKENEDRLKEQLAAQTSSSDNKIQNSSNGTDSSPVSISSGAIFSFIFCSHDSS